MKASELRGLSDAELEQRLEDVNKELFNLRIQKSTAQIEQPLRLRQLRREIARMHTLARERGIAAQRQKGLKA